MCNGCGCHTMLHVSLYCYLLQKILYGVYYYGNLTGSNMLGPTENGNWMGCVSVCVRECIGVLCCLFFATCNQQHLLSQWLWFFLFFNALCTNGVGVCVCGCVWVCICVSIYHISPRFLIVFPVIFTLFLFLFECMNEWYCCCCFLIFLFISIMGITAAQD